MARRRSSGTRNRKTRPAAGYERQDVKLIVQPDAGIDAGRPGRSSRAQEVVDICIFRFDRSEIEKALAAAVLRGVKVRALIAHTNRGGETACASSSSGCSLQASPSHAPQTTGALSRQVPGRRRQCCTCSASTSPSWTSTRAAASRSRRATARRCTEARKLFEADCTRQPYRARAIESGRQSRRTRATADRLHQRREARARDLRREGAGSGDPQAAQGTRGKRRDDPRDRRGEGADRNIGSARLKGMRLHVRAIVRDGTRAFVGSQSLRKLELESRREVGLLISNPSVAGEDTAGLRGRLGGVSRNRRDGRRRRRW